MSQLTLASTHGREAGWQPHQCATCAVTGGLLGRGVLQELVGIVLRDVAPIPAQRRPPHI